MAEVQEYTIFVLISLISIILLRAFLKKRSSPRLPPSPLALPIIGHLHLLGPIAHQAFAKISKRYGPLIHVYLGSVPCVVASSPEICKELLKTQEASFLGRPKTVVSDYVTYGSQDFTFAPYGEYWRFMKKLCVSQLLGGQTLDMQQPIRRDEMKYLIDFLLAKAKAGESVNMGSEFTRMANNLISRMVMSQRCSEDEKEAVEVRRLVLEINELTGKFNLSDYIWFCRNLDVQGIKKRLKVLHHRLDDLFIGGTDTSALSLEWGLSELINHPNVLRRAVQEIDSVVGKDRIVQESDLPRLPYLQAIVKETLRLHPPAPLIPRESTEDSTISGYHIPANTRLFVSIWAVGRDPKYWEDALEFKPERFLQEDGSVKGQLDVRGQNYHFLPFGTGRRGCPGTTLTLLLVQTALAAMIQCFDWKVEGEMALWIWKKGLA
ncbi:UNVERIFIED_CONTAM: cytochrome [Sesamum calycinum]|uniref:Cytochrome n=1 Tax=Sesamum calycinum TaxID=2727403 RepID=A0AAW2RU03_9LAMI